MSAGIPAGDAFENDRKRHRARIDALLDSITERAGLIRGQLADNGRPFVSEATNLATRAVHLVERLAALEALNEVSYLTEGDSDA